MFVFDFNVYAFDFDLTLSRYMVGQNIIASIVESFLIFTVYAFDF